MVEQHPSVMFAKVTPPWDNGSASTAEAGDEACSGPPGMCCRTSQKKREEKFT
jgi:hypothetical protein